MLSLRELGFEIIFLDEYAMSDNAIKPYGWAKRGQEAFVTHAPRKPCI